MVIVSVCQKWSKEGKAGKAGPYGPVDKLPRKTAQKANTGSNEKMSKYIVTHSFVAYEATKKRTQSILGTRHNVMVYLCIEEERRGKRGLADLTHKYDPSVVCKLALLH